MKAISTISLATFLFLLYNHFQTSSFYVAKPILKNSKLKKDLRLTQISDYHNNTRVDKDKLLKEIEKFNPHLILLTGDIIDRKTKDFANVIHLIKRLKNLNPNLYMVLGNHELDNRNREEFINRLEDLGVNLLNNEGRVKRINGEEINICGLGFYINKIDYEKTLTNMAEKNFTLLLSHSPNKVISYSKGKEDLILSGHTHGGQVRLPILGGLIAPGQKLFANYSKGIYKLPRSILYIDSGLGNSLLPLRTFNRIQISNIIIKAIDN